MRIIALLVLVVGCGGVSVESEPEATSQAMELERCGCARAEQDDGVCRYEADGWAAWECIKCNPCGPVYIPRPTLTCCPREDR